MRKMSEVWGEEPRRLEPTCRNTSSGPEHVALGLFLHQRVYVKSGVTLSPCGLDYISCFDATVALGVLSAVAARCRSTEARVEDVHAALLHVHAALLYLRRC